VFLLLFLYIINESTWREIYARGFLAASLVRFYYFEKDGKRRSGAGSSASGMTYSPHLDVFSRADWIGKLDLSRSFLTSPNFTEER